MIIRIFYRYQIFNPAIIKKFISICLLFALAFNSCGLPFFYWVKIQLCKIKAEYAEEHASGGALILISSAKKGVQRVNNTELLVDGKMYDIVKTTMRKGIEFFYTKSDKDEDADVSRLSVLEKDDAGEKSLPVKIFKLHELKLVIGQAENRSFVCEPLAFFNKFCINNTTFVYPLHFKDIFSPPPNFLFSLNS
jgi:hypothetical protein